MFENENLVTDVTENVEQTTEEIVEQIETPAPKTYTEEEVNQIVGKRLARNTAKIHKEYEKHRQLENVLKAGTGKEDVAEIANAFREYYKSKGVQMPSTPTYSDRDIEVLANAEAEEIIKSGFEDVVEEVDRLATLGTKNMSAKEKAVFKALAEYRQNMERTNELSRIGVTEEVYNSKAFKDFSAKFSSDTPVTEVYEIYNKMQPKKEVQTMGSMRSSQEPRIKDYYTPEEIARLTDADLDNEEVWNAVRRSMTKNS